MSMNAEFLSQAPALRFAEEGTSPSLAKFTGFYFAFRLFFVLLAVRVFQQEPATGVAASLVANYLLLLAAQLTAVDATKQSWKQIIAQPCFGCVAAYLLLTGASLSWSITASLPAAVAFWCAMVADMMIVALQLRSHAASMVMEAVASGYVWGASLVAVIAWVLPAQSDLRLGDEELLGPNQIGWLCGFAFFLAQLLMRQKTPGAWNVHALLLAVTLLRSLSKTSIVAFLAAQAYILVSDRSISRSTKRRLMLLAFAVVAVFSSLLSSYYDLYLTTGDQSENLTGRLGIWAYILGEAIDSPWIGHGFHAVWKVVPVFYGSFEARHAHNELLQQFYAYGIIGVTLLVATYTTVFRNVRRLGRSPVRVVFAGLLLFVLVRGLADTEAFDLSWPTWFLVLFGAFVAETKAKEMPV